MSQEEHGIEGGDPGVKKYVVFCVDGRKYGQPGYDFFTHEADVMMTAAASEVERGKLTPAEARELLEPYREVLSLIYTGEQQMVFDPDRYSWNEPDSFPTAEAVVESPQASQIFWYEVDELGIEGVTLVWSVPFPVLAPVRKKALEELREAVADEYKIVVKKDIDEFDAMGKSVEWARKLIEDAATTKDSRQSRPFSDAPSKEETEMSGETLIYGDDGQEGGLVFLEEDYIAELKHFCDALQSAATWGELRNMVSEERYQETLAVWKKHELRRLRSEKETDEEELKVSTPSPDDDFDIEAFPSYHDGDFPEFAPTMMDRWVDEEIIDEYGGYGATMTGYTAAINFENEEKVVSLLEEQGYVCIRDDDRIWAAVWRW